MTPGQRCGPSRGAGAAGKQGGHAAADVECTGRQASLDDALTARDEGVERALDGAHSWVRLNLQRHLDEIIASGVEFTTDDWRERAEPIATNPNIVGALIRKASAEGRIVQVGFRESRRPEAHARVIRVWRRAS